MTEQETTETDDSRELKTSLREALADAGKGLLRIIYMPVYMFVATLVCAVRGHDYRGFEYERTTGAFTALMGGKTSRVYECSRCGTQPSTQVRHRARKKIDERETDNEDETDEVEDIKQDMDKEMGT